VDVAISGSLKSWGVNHSDPVQQAESEPIPARRDDPVRRDDPMPLAARATPLSSERAIPPPRENTIHLRPTATLAERVLLPGDPGRALALAQFLLEQPLMFNHHRGLWGYTGTAVDGEPLTIQSTGMGGPSAAIVLHELISMGVTRAIRVGTCGALDPGLGLGDLVVAREAIAADGTSVALGAGDTARADPALTEALAQAVKRNRESGHREGQVVSTDLFYERDRTRNAGWGASGALAVEMEAAALFTVGANAGIQVGCLLAVSDNLHPEIQPPGCNPTLDKSDPTLDKSDARIRIDDHALTQAAEAMGRAAVAALRN
jgi:DeoD family purine-nucleoside phosphorylase